MTRTAPKNRPSLPVAVAAVSLLVALSVLSAMLLAGERLAQFGLFGNFWFVTLIVLGLATSVCLFALFKSYARYSGKALGGTLAIGGPAVLMLLIVVLGFRLVPAPATKFDQTVFLHAVGAIGRSVLRNQGRLTLYLGADARTEDIGSKGEVRFVGIPADQRGREVTVALDAQGYELAPGMTLTLGTEAVYLEVRASTVHLRGEVRSMDGRALANARLHLGEFIRDTDAEGRFDFLVPYDLPSDQRMLTVNVPGFRRWRGEVTPGSNELQVRLEPQ